MRGHPLGQVRDTVHDPCHRPAVALHRRVPELAAVRQHLRLPAEHLAVERQGGGIVPGQQLVPDRCPGFVDPAEAGMGLWLPDADGAAAGIAQHRRGALVPDDQRIQHHLPARRGGRIGGSGGIRGSQVNRPCVREGGLGRVGHHSGHYGSTVQEIHIAAGLLCGLRSFPAQQS